MLTLIFRLEASEQQKNILHLWSQEFSLALLTFLGHNIKLLNNSILYFLIKRFIGDILRDG